jgi:hypothetical protein
MRKTHPETKVSVVAWWLHEGTEECPQCGQLYAYELEFRCPDCDTPSCPHCKQQHPAGRAACRECAANCDQSVSASHG